MNVFLHIYKICCCCFSIPDENATSVNKGSRNTRRWRASQQHNCCAQRNPIVESFDHLESATINWRTKVLAWRCLAWITTNENPIMQNGFTHIRDPLHLIYVHVRRNLLPIPPRPFETHCFLLNSKCTRLLAALQDDLNVPM